MSKHTYQLPYPPTRDQIDRLNRATANAGRPISMWQVDGNQATLIFDQDLSPAEVTTLDEYMRAFKTDLTRAERNAIEPQIAEIKTFRQRSLATWNGLTAAQREADEIAYLNDLTDVLRALIRS